MRDREYRLAELREHIAEAELDGLVVSAPSNVLYLSGFRGSSGALLVTERRATLVGDFRYRAQAAEQAPEFEFVEVERRLLAGVGKAAAADGLHRMGYDPHHLSCALKDQLAEGARGVELVPAADLVEQLRARKWPAEVEAIRAAAALADRALEHMWSLLRPGATEREIALEGEFLMRRAGAEEVAFDTIVASGPRSALPHAETTDRALEPGDLVVIDLGARLRSYCSDMTRTFAVKSASPRQQELYRLVYTAQRAGLDAVRPGAVCGHVDAAARSIIDAAGYGEAFGHGLGHGVGLDVHEAPRLGRDEETTLAAGHVVTVEPGVYLEGEGGIRLEDLVAVREDGLEMLTGSPMPVELPVV